MGNGCVGNLIACESTRCINKFRRKTLPTMSWENSVRTKGSPHLQGWHSLPANTFQITVLINLAKAIDLSFLSFLCEKKIRGTNILHQLLKLSGDLCVYMCTCVCTGIFTCVQVHMHIEARGQTLLCLSVTIHCSQWPFSRLPGQRATGMYPVSTHIP